MTAAQDCPLSTEINALSASMLARAASGVPLDVAAVDTIGRGLAQLAASIRRIERAFNELLAEAHAEELARTAIFDLPHLPESALIAGALRREGLT